MNEIPQTVSRPLSVALIVSLCTNLLLVGAFLAFAWRSGQVPFHAMRDGGIHADRDGGVGRGGHHGGFGLRGPLNPRVLAEIAPDKAPLFREIMKAHRGKMDALRGQAVTARQTAARAMGQDPYDSAVFAKALKDVQIADAALEAEIFSIVAEGAEKLSPDERKAVFKYRIQDGPRHGPGPGPGPDGAGRGQGPGQDPGQGMGHGQGMGRGWNP